MQLTYDSLQRHFGAGGLKLWRETWVGLKLWREGWTLLLEEVTRATGVTRAGPPPPSSPTPLSDFDAFGRSLIERRTVSAGLAAARAAARTASCCAAWFSSSEACSAPALLSLAPALVPFLRERNASTTPPAAAALLTQLNASTTPPAAAALLAPLLRLSLG